MRWWTKPDWRESLPVETSKAERATVHGWLLRLFELHRRREHSLVAYESHLDGMMTILGGWRKRLAREIWKYKDSVSRPEARDEVQGWSIRRLWSAVKHERQERKGNWLTLISEYTGYHSRYSG